MTVSAVTEFSCSYLYVNSRTGKGELSSSKYLVEATVTREDKDKFIMEFSELRKYLSSCVPDRKFIFGPFLSKSEEELRDNFKKLGIPTYECVFDVSAETLCEDIATRLTDELAFDFPGVILQSVKLQENDKSSVVWHK